jgi:hypothetical protein
MAASKSLAGIRIEYSCSTREQSQEDIVPQLNEELKLPTG